MRDPVTAYVALGANLGDAADTVRRAVVHIGRLPDCRLTRQSSLYRTAPIDADGPEYVNAVVEVSTSRGALDFFAQLQRLEQEAGRQRPYRNAPRTLDLDLLLYGAARMDSTLLQLPHPRMTRRAFVLVPLAEIAPSLVEPAQLRQVADQPLARLAPM